MDLSIYRIVSYTFFLFSILCILSVTLSADTTYDITEIHINSISLETISTDNGTFIIPSYDNSVYIGNASYPGYLVKTVRLLLEYDKNVTSISVTPYNSTNQTLSYDLYPIQTPMCNESDPPFQKNDSYYNLTEQMLDMQYNTSLSVQYKKGYPVQMILLYPYNYVPDTRNFTTYHNFTINITYEDTASWQYQNDFLKNYGEHKQEIGNFVDNNVTEGYTYEPDLRGDLYPGGMCDASDNYDLVIITNQTFSSSSGFDYDIQDLVTQRTSDGLACIVVEFEDINTTSDYFNDTATFNDSACHVREFIKDAYLDWNVSYILIIGTWQLSGDDWENRLGVPVRFLNEPDNPHGWHDIPADIYYSNLDGDFYDDTQSLWGGGKDGDNDLLSELSVGRIPIWSCEQLSNIIEKILWYDACEDVDYLASAGFLGGDKEEPQVTSKEYMEELRNGTGYFSNKVGFLEWNNDNPSNEMNISARYYDEDYPTEDDAIGEWWRAMNNSNFSIVNHDDHGSWQDAFSIWYSTGCTNTKAFFGYSQACFSGRYVIDDSAVSYFLGDDNQSDAFALVLNTGYGYYSTINTNGASQLLHKTFFDYFFNDVSDNFSAWMLGDAMRYEKDETSGYVSTGYDHAYVWYSNNLFGDPSQLLKINVSEDLDDTNYSYHTSSFGGSVTVTEDDYTGPNWYVNTSGSDSNEGSIGSPFLTIQKAVNETSPGDTVYIMKGTYNERIEIKNNGTSGNTITIQPYSTDIVYINGSGKVSDWDGIIYGQNKSHIRITGLEINDSISYGIMFEYSNCHNITIDNCTIHNCANSSIYFRRVGAPNIFNVIVENNTCYDICGYPARETSTSNEGISFSGVDNFIIQDNYIYHCAKECIDIKSGSANGTCRNNIVNNTNSNPPDSNGIGIYVDAFSVSIFNITVERNFVYGNRTGYAIAGEQPGGLVENVTLQNNIANITDGKAFGIWNYNNPTYKNITIINNVFYSQNENAFFSNEDGANFTNFVIRNNILAVSNKYYVLKMEYFDLDECILDNNSFYDFGDTLHTEFQDGDNQYGDNAVTTDPEFSNLVNGEFWLNDTSPCIDSGSSVLAPSTDYNGTSRPVGSEYDIGAFETTRDNGIYTYHSVTFGGNVTVTYHWLYYIDVIEDNIIDQLDINNVLLNYLSHEDIRADVNDDGIVNYLDRSRVQYNYGETY